MELRQEFEKETKTRKPMTRTHEAYAYYYEKYAEWLEDKVVKLLATPAVSKCVQPVQEVTVCCMCKRKKATITGGNGAHFCWDCWNDD